MAGASGHGSARSDDLRFRVLELRRDPGGVHTEHRSVGVGSEQVGAARPSADPVEVSVRLEAVAGGVRVTGTVGFGWEGSCRRCLGPASGSAQSELSELFVDDPDGFHASADDDDEDEVHAITDGWIELSEVVRDSVLVGLPLAPLCREDCEGPAPGDFPVQLPGAAAADGEPEEDAGEGIDPRWAKLSEVTFADGPSEGDTGTD